MSIKLSIIIPCYNSMKYIKETLESCLNQTIINKEIILIDDKSTDGTKEYLLTVAKKHQMVCFIENEKNLGLSKTNQKALLMAKGEYVSFVGHDDFFDRDHFDKMVNDLDDNVVLAYCNSRLVDSNSNPILDSMKAKEIYILKSQLQEYKINTVYKSMGRFNFISSCGMVLKKEALINVGGWPVDFGMCGEWFLYTKLIDEGKFKFIDNVIGNYRRHETNITNSFETKDHRKAVNKYHQSCRISVLQNKKTSISDKLYIIYHIVKGQLKFHAKSYLKK